MKGAKYFFQQNDRGVALLIVLAFVVLLTGLVVAFLSRTSTHRQLAQASFSDAKAELLARGAIDILKCDLRQEINDGGAITAGNIGPQRSGTPSGSSPIANLVRISIQSDASSRASASSSTASSQNKRFISLARWNSHYLIPRASTAASLDSTPIASFTAPDWVLVTANGPKVLSPPADGVIGRYAYAIYDEGGLLDINVAGFPYWPDSPASAATPGVPNIDVGRKGSVALADLTGLATSPTVVTTTSNAPNWLTAAPINDIVGWRNYGTIQPGGKFSQFTFDSASGSSGTGSRFLSLFLNTNNGFLTAPASTTPGARTDQPFVSRGELLELRSSTSLSQSVLQYLGTFSRETNLPTWSDSATRLANRFPLNRFDAFANPNAKAADLKRYFGLLYVPADQSTPEHYTYIGANGTGAQSSIHVLTGNQQDPDLSVLLRYMYPSNVSDGEILSIIASLIDQRDTNSETTWIEYGDPANIQKAWGVDSTPPPNPNDPRPASPPVMLNRSFRNVGELGYAYRNAATPLDFLTPASVDAPILDLFTFNAAPIRAGVINLNTANVPVITAILTGATTSEAGPAFASRLNSYHTAQSVVTATTQQAALSRADIARVAGAAGTFLGTSNEARKTVVRALAEVSQTRTWNLMIDVIAQSGRYAPNTTSLDNFIVDGEKRYWLHIAIDRFTGAILDQQLEAVFQ